MIYRDYGKTGKKVSLIGFGGMRFGQIDKTDQCVEMMLHAAKGGVNYFDTAPAYFDTKGEAVFGEAFSEFRRRNIPFYCATKTMRSSEKSIRKEIEKQLKRLRIEAIDFYHVWCVTSLGQWHERKKNGVVKTFQKLKDEGLIHHICVSSHLIGEEIKELLREGIFAGVLFGYSAYNFKTRQAAFEAIASHNLGCVVMNPLGGGIIPDNPRRFDFIRSRADETVVEAALRFVFSHKRITTALVGFKNKSEVQEALKAVENYHEMSEREMETIKSYISDSFEGLCTGCRYCDNCPEGIPIPKLMEAFNHKKLYGTDKAMLERLKWHWQIGALDAEKCVACRQCEEACTQHLPIIERLADIASVARKSKRNNQENRRSDKPDSPSMRAKSNS